MLAHAPKPVVSISVNPNPKIIFTLLQFIAFSCVFIANAFISFFLELQVAGTYEGRFVRSSSQQRSNVYLMTRLNVVCDWFVGILN